MKPRFLLCAEEAAGAEALTLLIESDATLAGVLTTHPLAETPSRIVRIAKATGIPLFPAEYVKDSSFAANLEQLNVQVLLNVHSLHLIASKILEVPKLGSFNVHPGPLPEYAGLNAAGWAIANGETEFGTTLHWMAHKVDAGDIAFQERFPIDPAATALTLGIECARRTRSLIRQLLDALSMGLVPRLKQDLSSRRYFAGEECPGRGFLPWWRSAQDVARFVRAFDHGPFTSPWGRPVAFLGGQRVEIARVTVSGPTNGETPGTLRPGPDHTLEIATRNLWVTTKAVWLNGDRTSVGALLALGHSLTSPKHS
jgi:methionyl-tRNA formyltransferase